MRNDSLTDVESLQCLEVTHTEWHVTQLVVTQVKVSEPICEDQRELDGVGTSQRGTHCLLGSGRPAQQQSLHDGAETRWRS